MPTKESAPAAPSEAPEVLGKKIRRIEGYVKTDPMRMWIKVAPELYNAICNFASNYQSSIFNLKNRSGLHGSIGNSALESAQIDTDNYQYNHGPVDSLYYSGKFSTEPLRAVGANSPEGATLFMKSSYASKDLIIDFWKAMREYA